MLRVPSVDQIEFVIRYHEAYTKRSPIPGSNGGYVTTDINSASVPGISGPAQGNHCTTNLDQPRISTQEDTGGAMLWALEGTSHKRQNPQTVVKRNTDSRLP